MWTQEKQGPSVSAISFPFPVAFWDFCWIADCPKPGKLSDNSAACLLPCWKSPDSTRFAATMSLPSLPSFSWETSELWELWVSALPEVQTFKTKVPSVPRRVFVSVLFFLKKKNDSPKTKIWRYYVGDSIIYRHLPQLQVFSYLHIFPKCLGLEAIHSCSVGSAEQLAPRLWIPRVSEPRDGWPGAISWGKKRTKASSVQRKDVFNDSQKYLNTVYAYVNYIAIELYAQYITSAIICNHLHMATPAEFPKNYVAKSHLQCPTHFESKQH